MSARLDDAVSLARNAGFEVDVRGPTDAPAPIVVTLLLPDAGTAYGVGGTVTLYAEAWGSQVE